MIEFYFIIQWIISQSLDSKEENWVLSSNKQIFYEITYFIIANT